MGLFSTPLWKKYQNEKLGNNFDYMVMRISEREKRAYAQINIETYVRHFNESINLIDTTKKPNIFFERYNFALERAIALIYMKKYVKVSMSSPEKSADKLIEHKQELVKDMIYRRGCVLQDKLSSLKTSKSRLNNIKKFEEEFVPYYGEMSQKNIDYIKQIANFYRQHCEKE